MSKSCCFAIAAGLTAFVANCGGGHAQSQTVTISIGRITAEKTCTLYQESSGESAFLATRHAIAAVDSWRTWFVRDCVNNFATMRASLEAALAASGVFAVKPSGAKYSLSGTISQVGGEGNPQTDTISTGGYSISSSKIFASMEISLRDVGGRVVYGGLLTKHLEIGSNIQTPGMSSSSSQSGQTVYEELQNQLALAAARSVAFHVVPLRVIASEGDRIRLNYGAPLLVLGTIVHATSADGITTVRYTVTSSDAGGATAEKDGSGNSSKIAPGSTAIVVEADDPAANERRYQRVDLP